MNRGNKIKSTINGLDTTLLGSKERKKSYISTLSSVLTTKRTTKQTATLVHSRKTILIRIGIVKNNRSSIKVE